MTFCPPLEQSRSVAEDLRAGKMWLSGASSDAKPEHRRALTGARGAQLLQRVKCCKNWELVPWRAVGGARRGHL